MSSRKSLWSRSIHWRWILITTLLATVLAGYIGFIKTHGTKPGGHKAAYIPSPGKIPGKSGGLRSVSTARINNFPAQSTTGNQTVYPKVTSHKTFDIPVRQKAESFPPDTEMHLIGIYQGAPPDGQQQTPWWAKCKDLGLDISDPKDGEKCHQLLAGKHEAYSVTVAVTRNRPMVLVLMAYEPVLWKITGNGLANIKKIILAGYNGQNIDGVAKSIPIEVYTHKSSSCKQCNRRSGHFYAYKKQSKDYKRAVKFLQNLTGLYPTSFQGAYEENSFYISDSIVSNGSRGERNVGKITDPYRGKIFVDSVSLVGREIPLPVGKWVGIFYEKIPFSRGRDEVLVLADIHQQTFQKLVAVRVRETNDGKGFVKNPSCEQKNIYAGKTLANKPFGNQLCNWLEYLDEPWKQPIFGASATRLSLFKKVSVPTQVFNVGFHRSNKNYSETVHFYIVPDDKKIPTPIQWHSGKTAIDNGIQGNIQKIIDWADIWFQIFINQ